MPTSELHHIASASSDTPALGVAVPDGLRGFSSEATQVTGWRVARPYAYPIPRHIAAWVNNTRQLILLSFLAPIFEFFGPLRPRRAPERFDDLEAGLGRQSRHDVDALTRHDVETMLRRFGLEPFHLEELRRPDRVGAIIQHNVNRRRGASAAPAEEALSEAAKRFEGILNQCYAACLPTCAMSYPLLKDAPDRVKLVMYLGLAFITLTVYIGMLSKSETRARMAIRLVSCTAVTVLTFSVASLLSVPTYVLVLTALVAGAMNLIILLMPI